MREERRKYFRSKCLLPAEMVELEGKNDLSTRVSVHDFSQEGLKVIIHFIHLHPGSNIELKIYLPEKKLSTLLSAEIAWAKFADNKLEMGLKTKQLDKIPKDEILNWVFPRWMKKEEGEEEKQ